MDKILNTLFEHINKVGFRFWVCPNGCNDMVTWEGTTATCEKCGETNEGEKMHNDT